MLMGTKGVDENSGPKYNGGSEILKLLINDIGTILIG